jgi:hypothetical protein
MKDSSSSGKLLVVSMAYLKRSARGASRDHHFTVGNRFGLRALEMPSTNCSWPPVRRLFRSIHFLKDEHYKME